MNNFYLYALIISLLFVISSSFLSYYFSKNIAKRLKNVQTISNKKEIKKSEKINGLLEIITEFCEKFDINIPEVGIYPSREINAFATGRSKNTMIAFSSNMINKFTLNELKGVIGHEISHLANRDLSRIILFQGFFDFIKIISNHLIINKFNNKIREDKKEDRDNIFIIFTSIFIRIIYGFIDLMSVPLVLFYNRRRELEADSKSAEMFGIDNMLISLKKLLLFEQKKWIVDGVDIFQEKNNFYEPSIYNEPNSISLIKFNSKRRESWLSKIFRSHPTLEDRISILEKKKKDLEKDNSKIIYY